MTCVWPGRPVAVASAGSPVWSWLGEQTSAELGRAGQTSAESWAELGKATVAAESCESCGSCGRAAFVVSRVSAGRLGAAVRAGRAPDHETID